MIGVGGSSVVEPAPRDTKMLRDGGFNLTAEGTTISQCISS